MLSGEGTIRRGLAAALLAGAVAFIAFPHPDAGLAARPTINVGTKNFSEEYLITDMYSLLLQRAGFKVHIKNLAKTPVLQNALLRGDIDLYPEYTGTGLQVVLKHAGSVHDAARAFELDQQGYRKFHLTWLQQSQLNNTNGVGVTFGTAKKYGLHNLADLARVSGSINFAALPDCRNRADCLVGLQNRYGMRFKSVTFLDAPPVIYKGLKSGQFDAVEVFTTDGAIQALAVDVLQDNRGLFPADHIAPVVRNDVLARYPRIRTILDRLPPYLTTREQKSMNYQVDILGKDPMAVAAAFLRSKRLIS